MAYCSPKLEGKHVEKKDYYGLFARTSIQRGELLVVWSGEIYNHLDMQQLPEEQHARSIQVEEDIYLVPMIPDDPADYVNHSCNPNAGLSGQIALVAMRDIKQGEEICFDYAMSDASPYDEFICLCGATHCRKRITGNDWLLPELQKRYAGYFSPYIQRRIDRLHAKQHK